MSPGNVLDEPAALANGEIKSIVIIIAMAAEASPFVEHMNLQKNENIPFPKESPWTCFSGMYEEIEVNVLTPGKDKNLGVDNVGTVPSSILCYAAINILKPHLVINAGTAGGFKSRGACIGDVFFASHVVNHDRRIQLPGFDKYGIGGYQTLHAPKLLKALNLKSGIVSSGNSFDLSEEDSKYINQNEAVIKDMEAAGIAWVTSMLNVPLVVLKSVTDIVDGDRPTTDEFLENLHSASEALRHTLPRVLAYFHGHTLLDL